MLSVRMEEHRGRLSMGRWMGCMQVRARLSADAEEREAQRLACEAMEAMLQRLRRKLQQFSQLEQALVKEKAIAEVICQAASSEWFYVLSHAHRILEAFDHLCILYVPVHGSPLQARTTFGDKDKVWNLNAFLLRSRQC